MPGVDGWTFLDMLDEADPESNISVFLHSSSDNESDKDRAKSFGRVCNYITKPLDPLKISVFEGITSKISRLRRFYNGGVLILSCLQMDIFKAVSVWNSLCFQSLYR